MPPNGDVTYSFRELLDKIGGDLTQANNRLDKIHERLVKLEGEPSLDQRVRALEDERNREAGASAYRRYVLPICVTLLVNAVGWALFLFPAQ